MIPVTRREERWRAFVVLWPFLVVALALQVLAGLVVLVVGAPVLALRSASGRRSPWRAWARVVAEWTLGLGRLFDGR